MMVNKFLASVAALTLVSTSFVITNPTSAQETGRTFSVPQGCEAFLTVQTRSCMVSHSWTCDGDPEGSHWRVTLDEDGPFYLSYTDREFRWLRSWSLRAEITSVLVEPEEDPASLSELLATGRDTMNFTLLSEGPRGTAQRTYNGFDALTGSQVDVDGETLEVTEFSYAFDTPDGLRQVAGSQFVHREWMMFFGGIETTTLANGETAEDNHSPMEFAEPGELGFLSVSPIYDCGEMMSDLSTDPVWRVSQ